MTVEIPDDARDRLTQIQLWEEIDELKAVHGERWRENVSEGQLFVYSQLSTRWRIDGPWVTALAIEALDGRDHYRKEARRILSGGKP